MIGMDEVRRLALFVVAVGVFAAPLAYAQSGLFIGSKKNKAAQEESEGGGKTRLFIIPGQKNSQEKRGVFKMQHAARKQTPVDPYAELAKSADRLVMPNMDMRGNKTPTKEDLMVMLIANNAENFEIVRNESALTMKAIQSFYAERDEERVIEQNKESVEKIKDLAEQIQSDPGSQPGPRTTSHSGKRQVYVSSKSSKKVNAKSSSDKPKRIFNSYD